MGDRKEVPINPPTAVIKCRQRLMGFKLLFELVLEEENGDQRSAYLCKLCGWITPSDRLLKHLTSFRHRLLCLEQLTTTNYSCGWANEIRLLITDGKFEEANKLLWSFEEMINYDWEKPHFDQRLNFVLSLSDATKKLVPSLWIEQEEPTMLELKLSAPPAPAPAPRPPPPFLVSPNPMITQQLPMQVPIPNPVPIVQMDFAVQPPASAHFAPPYINDDLAILITKLIDQQMDFGQSEKRSFQRERALFFYEILKAGANEVADCVLPPALLNCKDTLIGLNFIAEVMMKDLDVRMPCFVCKPCGWIRTSNRLIVHLLSARHRLNTIRSCGNPSWVAEIEYLAGSNDYHSADRLLAQRTQELGLVIGHEHLNHRINGFITMDRNCKLMIPSLWRDGMESDTIKGMKQQQFLPTLLQNVKTWLNITPNPIPSAKTIPNPISLNLINTNQNPTTWAKTTPIKRRRRNRGRGNRNRTKSNDEPHSKRQNPDSQSKPINDASQTKPIRDTTKPTNDTKSKAAIETTTQSKSASDIQSTPIPIARPRHKGLLDEGNSPPKAKSKVSFVSQPLPTGNFQHEEVEDICSPSFEPIFPESLPQSVPRPASTVTLSSQHSTSPPQSSTSTTETKTGKAIAPEIQQQLSDVNVSFNVGSKPIPQATMLNKSSKQPNLTNVVQYLPAQEVGPSKSRNADDINIPIGMEISQIGQLPHSELTDVEMDVVASALASLSKKAETLEKSAAEVQTDYRKVMSPARKGQTLHKPMVDNVLSSIHPFSPATKEAQTVKPPAAGVLLPTKGGDVHPRTPVAREAETFENSAAAAQILSMLQGGMSSVARDPQTLNAAAQILSIIQGDSQPVAKAATFEKSAAEIMSLVQGGDTKMATSPGTDPQTHQKSMAEILSTTQGGGRKMVNPYINKPPSAAMNVMSGFSTLIGKTTVPEEPKLTSTVNYGASKILTPEHVASTSQRHVPSTSQTTVQSKSQDETIQMLEGLAAPTESKKSSMESVLRKLIEDEKEKQKTQEQQQKMLLSLLTQSLAKEDEDSSSDDDSSDDGEELKKIAKRSLEAVKHTKVIPSRRSYQRRPPPRPYDRAHASRPPPRHHRQPHRGPPAPAPVQSISRQRHREPDAPGVDGDLIKLAKRSLEAIKGTTVKKADSAPSNDNSVQSIRKRKEIADRNNSEKVAEKTVQPVIQID